MNVRKDANFFWMGGQPVAGWQFNKNIERATREHLHSQHLTTSCAPSGGKLRLTIYSSRAWSDKRNESCHFIFPHVSPRCLLPSSASLGEGGWSSVHREGKKRCPPWMGQ